MMATTSPGMAPARRVPLVVLVASLGAVTVAFAVQRLFGLVPCELCLYQRVPYMVAAMLATIGVGLPPEGRIQTVVLTLAGAVFLVGAGLAVYHVGVQNHWWMAPGCGGVPATQMTLEDLRARLQGPAGPPCDRIDWSLFGISLAGYNAIVSLGLAIFSLAGAVRIWRSRTP